MSPPSPTRVHPSPSNPGTPSSSLPYFQQPSFQYQQQTQMHQQHSQLHHPHYQQQHFQQQQEDDGIDDGQQYHVPVTPNRRLTPSTIIASPIPFAPPNFPGAGGVGNADDRASTAATIPPQPAQPPNMTPKKLGTPVAPPTPPPKKIIDRVSQPPTPTTAVNLPDQPPLSTQSGQPSRPYR